MMRNKYYEFNKCSIWKKIVIIDFFSVIAAYFLVNYLDILTTDYRWIQWIKTNGLFHIYDSWDIAFPVDYPPLYLVWLYLIRNIVGDVVSNYTQLVMKLLPLGVQVISQIFIYKKVSAQAALKWSINAALLVNITIYGQRDGIVGLFIVMMYYFMKKNKWLEPALVVTVFCLLKPQGIYFIIILIGYYIVNKTEIKKIISAAGISIALGYLAFLPFAITTGDYLISIKLYLYEFGIHKVFGSVAGNIWGLFEFKPLPIAVEQISGLLILLCVLVGVIVYIKTKDFIYSSVIYMFSIFMFTIAQHGRYSIYTMFIMFIAIYLYGKKEYCSIYEILTVSTMLAQLGMIIYNFILIESYGLDVINSKIQMTYSMLYLLYAIRYSTILITFVLNIVVFFKLWQIGLGIKKRCREA